jgi:hypothetical protein
MASIEALVIAYSRSIDLYTAYKNKVRAVAEDDEFLIKLLYALHDDISALAQALKNAPPDLDTVPGRSLLVFGTYDHSECTCNLRYIGFPNNVSAIMSTPSYMYKPSPALLKFLDDEFDYCIEENIRLTREEALCLRPVLKALKMPGLGRKGEIWYCGYHCSIDLGYIIDGELRM